MFFSWSPLFLPRFWHMLEAGGEGAGKPTTNRPHNKVHAPKSWKPLPFTGPPPHQSWLSEKPTLCPDQPVLTAHCQSVSDLWRKGERIIWNNQYFSMLSGDRGGGGYFYIFYFIWFLIHNYELAKVNITFSNGPMKKSRQEEIETFHGCQCHSTMASHSKVIWR